MADWDWKKLIPSWGFNTLAIDNYPSWEKIDGNSIFVILEITKGVNISSRDIAIQWDDESNGAFYYRDWTKSGLPFVDDGEVYWSGFWFQFQSDAVRFNNIYGGSGNWQPGHNEFVEAFDKRRSGR